MSAGPKVGEGGEGVVYELAGDPGRVLKIYYNGSRTAELEAKLRVMVARVRSSRSLLELYNPRVRAQVLPGFTWRHLHHVAGNLAIAVNALHAAQVVVGDLNEGNIVVGANALVTLLDTDSFQVRDPGNGAVYRCRVGKPEFTAPEIQGRAYGTFDRTEQHDAFGLAVLLFQLLMEGFHPFSGVPTVVSERSAVASHHIDNMRDGVFPFGGNSSQAPPPHAPPFTMLHPDLRSLFRQCFETGLEYPALRPSPYQWAVGLIEASKALVACQARPEHWYSGHLATCPWCAREQRHAPALTQTPFPAEAAAPPPQAVTPTPTQSPPPAPPPPPAGGRSAQPTAGRHVPLPPTPNTAPSGPYQPSPEIERDAMLGIVVILATTALILLFGGLQSCAASPLASPRTIYVEVTRIRSVSVTATPAMAEIMPLDGYPSSMPSPVSSESDSIPTVTPTARPSPVLSPTLSPTETAIIGPANISRIVLLAQLDESASEDLAYSPDSTLIAAGSPDGIYLCDTVSLEVIRTVAPGSWISSVAFSPDGRTLASGPGLGDNIVRLWDPGSGNLLKTLEGHAHHVVSLSFSPDGRMLASGSSDRTVRIWDASSGALLHTLEGDWGMVHSVAFSPNGRTLASGWWDGNIRLWDASSGILLKTLEEERNSVYSVAFSPDGRILASGWSDGTVGIWDIDSGRLLNILEGVGRGWVTSVAFSPDGRMLASGKSSDGTIYLWDASSGRLLNALGGEGAGHVTSLAFSPNGQTLASGRGSATVWLWGVGQ